MDLETLKELKLLVDGAIAYGENQSHHMTLDDIGDYQKRFWGEYDFMLGNFGIKRIQPKRYSFS